MDTDDLLRQPTDKILVHSCTRGVAFLFTAKLSKILITCGDVEYFGPSAGVYVNYIYLCYAYKAKTIFYD